jgi:hypothetical protein
MQQLNRQRNKITKDDFNEEVDFLGPILVLFTWRLRKYPF